MCGNWLFICGGRSEEKNRRQKKSKSMVKPVEHEPLRAVSGSGSWDSATVTSEKKEAEVISKQDVDNVAYIFINGFHRNLELQRTLSDPQYYSYLKRSTS